MVTGETGMHGAPAAKLVTPAPKQGHAYATTLLHQMVELPALAVILNLKIVIPKHVHHLVRISCKFFCIFYLFIDIGYKN